MYKGEDIEQGPSYLRLIVVAKNNTARVDEKGLEKEFTMISNNPYLNPNVFNLSTLAT